MEPRDVREELDRLRAELAAVREQLAELTEVFGGAHVATTFETLAGAALLALPPLRTEGIPAYLARSEALLTGNRHTLSVLENAVTRRAAVRDWEAVLNLSRAAGDWSSSHHPGAYTSGVIEGALRSLGASLPTGPAARTGNAVLHVMTVAYGVGGHTRLAARWMDADSSNVHSLVLTEQAVEDVPPSLTAAATGGCRTLEGGTPLARVTELAELARGYDAAVLHLHPYDAVAVAAANAADFPPAVFVDHGDHVFWLGVTSAAAVASLRDSGRDVLVHRRSVDPSRIVHLPLPLRDHVRNRSRADAKAALDIDPDAVLLLSVASAHKYAPLPPYSFAEAVADVLGRHSDATFIVVGPNPRAGQWASLADRFPDRVRVIAADPEIGDVLEAADVYLDSFPFSSLTSLCEAALLGTPVVSLRLPEAGPMALDDPAVHLPVSTDLNAWHRRVDALVRSADRRTADGSALAKELADVHSCDAIAAAIQRAYAAAAQPGGPAVPSAEPGPATAADAYLAAYQHAARLGRPAEVLLASYGLLPAFLSR